MPVSRRDFARLVAGSGALAALGQLGRAASVAQTAAPYRAIVGVFLFGGNDAWNMVVPTDGRYAQYASHRGATLALPQAKLSALAGVPYGLHPALAPLQTAWNDGALGVVLNTGSLYQPMNKALYQSRPDLRPLNLMSHADEQNHWQGNQVRSPNLDGFMGRMLDQVGSVGAVPQVMSFAGSNLALIGKTSSPLILGSSGSLAREGFNPSATDAPTLARQAALAAFADASANGTVTAVTGKAISAGYDQAVIANAILSSTNSQMDQFFKNPVTGLMLTSDISKQLLRTARMIEARKTLGQNNQVFFTSQGGFDTHINQVDAADTTTGVQAGLYADLGMALAAFYEAMKALGLQNEVTAFTMSDFGRTFAVNAQRGTDHAWGNNHLVLGGALSPKTVFGAYPDMTFGGPDDISANGRWLPSTATEQYLGAIVGWSGIPDADMPYVFPNWTTWSTGGQSALPLFAPESIERQSPGLTIGD